MACLHIYICIFTYKYPPSHDGRLVHCPDASHSSVPDAAEGVYPAEQVTLNAVPSGLSPVGVTDAPLAILLTARLAAVQVSTTAASRKIAHVTSIRGTCPLVV